MARQLIVELVGDHKKFSKSLDDANRDTDSFVGKMAGHSGNIVGSIAKMGAAAVAAAGTMAVAFGVKAVLAASDLAESISKVDTVFGKSAEKIQEWSKSTAGSIGISRDEALGAAGTFGNMFTQLGIGTGAAAKMSTSMVELAADFASFHNADISDVLQAQQAAFRGEYDSLQRFLPLINAGTVAQKAMAMTGKKNVDALTAQEKALAVNALMSEGAGKAAGDFARTSGGLANQMRILKAEGADFAANVGSVLIPFVLRGLEIFKELAGTLKDMVGPAFEKVKEFVEPLGAVFETVIGIVKGFTDKFKTDSEDVGTKAGALMVGIGLLRDLFVSAFGAIQAVVETVVGVVKGIWRVFGDDLSSFTGEFVATILETFRGAINVLTGIFDLIKAVLTGKWGEAWTAVKTIMDGAWDLIFGVVRGAVTNVIPTILAGLGQAVASIARTAFDGLIVAFKATINGILGLWNNFSIPAMKVGPVQVSPEINFPDLPTFAAGGVIPGSPGMPAMVVAHGGERILPLNGSGGQGGMMVVVNVAGSVSTERRLVEAIQDGLLSRQRRAGGLGFA